eukprot:GGOE01036577.1.p1 GENE.GGOE01036577.1~~GGOE01036577.1.p1  ORF type:complete len:354 (+),score=35.11 GGOE01036577.1:109-1170(+)
MRTFERKVHGINGVVLLKEQPVLQTTCYGRQQEMASSSLCTNSCKAQRGAKLLKRKQTSQLPRKRARRTNPPDVTCFPTSSNFVEPHVTTEDQPWQLDTTGKAAPPPVRLSHNDMQKLHDKKVWCGTDDACVISLPTNTINHPKFLMTMQRMDRELGHAMDGDINKDTTAFFFVDAAGRILGALLAERIDSAYLHEEIVTQEAPERGKTANTQNQCVLKAFDNIEVKADGSHSLVRESAHTPKRNSRQQTRSSSFEAPPSPETAKVFLWAENASKCKSPEAKFNWCICGINRIWVNSCARRRGIATTLVEVARERLVYGYAIPQSQVAFSQPTRDGKLFAHSYTGTTQLMVYY